MSLSATLFGRDSAIFKATNILGLGIPGWLDKKFGAKDLNIEGPRLSDLSVQTSTYGAPIPRLYGTIAVMGNLIWLENNRLKETVRKKKSSSGGKGGGGGGGSSEPTTTYSYSATFHLALGEGSIAGIRRMWCGDKLIYNAGSGDIETIIASNKSARGWRLYLGTETQLPDSRYEANVGVGNASAHRGLAYIAFYDFQLADYSNTLQGSQFKVEVVTAGVSCVLPIDATPAISDDFGYLRVFGEIGDLYGVTLMDNSTPRGYEGTSASFDVREYRLGSLKPQTEQFIISGIAETEYPSTCRSSDGRLWYQYKSTDTFITGRPHLRSDDGIFIHMNSSVTYAQDIIEYSRQSSGSLTQFNFILSYSSTPDRSRLDKIGFVPAFGSGGPYDIAASLAEAAGWNICTAGDTPFEWNITGASDASAKQFNIRTYNAALSGVVDSFSGDLPDAWPRMTSGSRQGQKVTCRILDGVVYLLGKDRTDDSIYRFAMISSGGTQVEYEFSSANAVGEELYSIWPHDENQGLALTRNRIIQWRRYNEGGADVGQIISSEVSLSGLIGPVDIDTSLISGTARGYRVNGGSIRSSIEPLQAAFPFDVRQHGYLTQFLPRGQSSVVIIPWDDLGAVDSGNPGDIMQRSREMDPQLPARTTIKYLDAAREYAISEQSSERLNTEAVNKVERELPLVLAADEAAGAAEMLNFLPWLERTDAAFTLPPIYRYLEPGDVVTVSAPTATYELRLTDINESQGGLVECEALPNRAALYTPSATGAEGVPPTGTIPLAGNSLFVPLDIPVIDETLQNAPGFVGVMAGDTQSWPGGIVVRSADNGQTWTDLQAYTGKATIGTARDMLPASTCTLIDQRTLTVDLISGELEGVTRDQMLAGVNYAAYGLDGRWEIVRFQNSALQVDGSHLLSGFVRGEKGTEWAAGLHAVGDYFVLLDDPDNAFIGSAVDSILAPRLYRGITSGGALDDSVDVPFTYRGVNLECLSPVYAKGGRDGSSNFTGTFTRRSRLSSSWWTTGVQAPVGEASESYEIDVMSGSTVKRTIAVTSSSFTYSAANQTTDFGSAQPSLTFRIYQLSELVGRGYPLEVTL